MTKASKNRQTQHPKNSSPKPNRAAKRILRTRPKARSSPKVAAGQCARQAAKSADAEVDRERQELYAAIERDWTPKVQKAVLNFARKRVTMMASAGIQIQASHAEHIVADAVSDTAIGSLTWRRGVPFSTHLFAVVRSRTAKLVAHTQRFRCVPIVPGKHPTFEEGKAIGSLISASPYEKFADAELLQHYRTFLECESALRKDDVALDILRHYAQGYETRAEISRRVGIDLQTFDRARERLVGRAKRFCEHLAVNVN